MREAIPSEQQKHKVEKLQHRDQNDKKKKKRR